MGYVRDRWTDAPPGGGRRVRNARWGRGRRWQAVWTDAAGRRHAAACVARDEAQALIREREGQAAPTPDVPLEVWLRKWAAGQLHWAPATRENATRAIEGTIIPSLPGETVQGLTRARVQEAVTSWSQQRAASTVRMQWAYLRAPMRQAVHDGLIDRSPCEGVRLPRSEGGRLSILTVDQVHQIEAQMIPHLTTMVTVAAATGMRSGELRGLTWDRIDGDVITVDRQLSRESTPREPVWSAPKTPRSVRTVTVGRLGLEALERQREACGSAEGLVWSSPTGSPVSHTDAGRAWRRATRGMGLWGRSGWHDLRHFHASLLIHAGMSPRAVADRLGHSDVTVTLNVYSHLWPSDDARAAAVADEALSDKGATRLGEHGGG